MLELISLAGVNVAVDCIFNILSSSSWSCGLRLLARRFWVGSSHSDVGFPLKTYVTLIEDSKLQLAVL